MEEIIIERLKSLAIADPVVASILLAVVRYFKWKFQEISGWLLRLERKMDDGKREITGTVEELRTSIREGLKEERSFLYDSLSKMDTKIFELAKNGRNNETHNRL